MQSRIRSYKLEGVSCNYVFSLTGISSSEMTLNPAGLISEPVNGPRERGIHSHYETHFA